MQAFLRTVLVVLAAIALLAACAPAQPTISAEEIQAQVSTSVALTVAAQNAQAAQAQSAATATLQPAPIEIPSLTPIFPTVTPFTVVPVPFSGGGGGGAAPLAKYACSYSEVKPRINVFKPGDNFNVVWIITNTGTRPWPDPSEINFFGGTKISPFISGPLPGLKSGDRTTVSFDAIAPNQPGFYEMKFKVAQGFCFPVLDIQVKRPVGQDP